MTYTDWTITGNNGSCSLDATTKYTGNSSLQEAVLRGDGAYVNLTHNTFSQTQTQLIFWFRNTADISNGPYTGGVRGYVNHSSYGDIPINVLSYNTWEKYRISYWYDLSTNTKWGRIERWDNTNWIQVNADYNFGANSPSISSIKLKTTGFYTGLSSYGTGYCWFDELEVYS